MLKTIPEKNELAEYHAPLPSEEPQEELEVTEPGVAAIVETEAQAIAELQRDSELVAMLEAEAQSRRNHTIGSIAISVCMLLSIQILLPRLFLNFSEGKIA